MLNKSFVSSVPLTTVRLVIQTPSDFEFEASIYITSGAR